MSEEDRRQVHVVRFRLRDAMSREDAAGEKMGWLEKARRNTWSHLQVARQDVEKCMEQLEEAKKSCPHDEGLIEYLLKPNEWVGVDSNDVPDELIPRRMCLVCGLVNSKRRKDPKDRFSEKIWKALKGPAKSVSFDEFEREWKRLNPYPLIPWNLY
jgi:hypothetical protein